MLRFVNSSTTGVVQTFGKFTRLAPPGLHFYIPIVQRFDTVCNRLRQIDSKIKIKTKDNVFVELSIAIQFQVKSKNSGIAFFSLQSPYDQINAYVENTVRSQVPLMDLDKLFESHNEISDKVNMYVNDMMKDYGYDIVNTMIKDISPSKDVQHAMNQINASQRLREAAKNEAEALYIKEIRQAEADRDRKRLQGEGTSQQRQAIMDGYQKSIQNASNNLNMTSKEVSDMVLQIQHLDMLELIGRSDNAKVIFVDKNNSKLQNNIMEANQCNFIENAK